MELKVAVRNLGNIIKEASQNGVERGRNEVQRKAEEQFQKFEVMFGRVKIRSEPANTAIDKMRGSMRKVGEGKGFEEREEREQARKRKERFEAGQ